MAEHRKVRADGLGVAFRLFLGLVARLLIRLFMFLFLVFVLVLFPALVAHDAVLSLCDQ